MPISTDLAAFAEAAGNVVSLLGAARTRELAEHIEAGVLHHQLLQNLNSVDADAIRTLINAQTAAALEGAGTAVHYLRGLADGYARQEARCQVDTVWSGPTTHQVPVRSTAAVLLEVIAEASHELVLMTYSAKPQQPLREALTAAADRGVAITVVVETLQGAGSAMGGSEPATAFADLRRVELWYWPPARRTENGAKQHAKLAAADRSTLFVTSANLTASGSDRNIESGLLVRGGTAPGRAVEHIKQLRASGWLQRL